MSTNAESSRGSWLTKVPISALHSVPDAANPSSMTTVVESSPMSAETKRNLIGCVCMLTGLSCNVLSPDVWALASYHAEDLAIKHGLSPEDFKAFLQDIMPMIDRNRMDNPASCLF